MTKRILQENPLKDPIKIRYKETRTISTQSEIQKKFFYTILSLELPLPFERIVFI
jgi:hypothetical protein